MFIVILHITSYTTVPTPDSFDVKLGRCHLCVHLDLDLDLDTVRVVSE